MNRLIGLFLMLVAVPAYAHHSVLSEFGDLSRPTTLMEGQVVRIAWRNPHVWIDIQVIEGDDIEPGAIWRVTTHPTHILDGTYDFRADQFSVGDVVRAHGWKHLDGKPLFNPRALQVNDGPMRSLLGSADARDIAAGTLLDKGIVPSKTLNGSSPGRAGKEAVDGLRALGYLDEDNLIDLPDDFRRAAGMD